MNKKLLIPMAAIAVIGASVYGVAQVSAANDNTNDPRASLIQKLTDTFHLDKAKVQAVFDEHHKGMQKQHETKYEDRLAQAVKDGKITEAQKASIIAEHNKLKGMIEGLHDKTEDERKAAKQAIESEIEAWAKQTGLSRHWLMGFGLHLRGGHGMVQIDHGPGFGPGKPTPDEMPKS